LPLPSAFDSDDLPNLFGLLYRENPHHQEHLTACLDTYFAGNPLLTFEPITDEFVLKLINNAPGKSCELDPNPTMLLY